MAAQEHTQENGDNISVSLEALAKSMEAKLYDDSPLSAKCCIFRIPEVFRRHNEKAYEPDVIAIGPFHHRKPSLQPMQKVKQWYLRTLLLRLNRTGLNTSMLSLVKGIKEFEEHARDCYQEPIGLDQNEFIEMLIIDGCFLVELFRKEEIYDLGSKDDPIFKDELKDDPIFSMSCMHEFLHHDLLLLENQFPWFVLQSLFDLTMENDQSSRSLAELVLYFFGDRFSPDNLSTSTSQSHRENLHIVDLIRNVLTSSFQDDQSNGLPEWPKRIPCVTNLVEAGVKFTKSSSNKIMDIEFKDGTFKIPQLFIHETTESFFRNQIAFEQCYGSCKHKITSYAILMDNLINTGKDMEKLSDEGIIYNWMSAEDASQYFNRLYDDTYVKDFYYLNLCKKVDEYCQTKRHRWRANLMRDYFTTPWSIISVVAAFILLVLTFLQTLYSMM